MRSLPTKTSYIGHWTGLKYFMNVFSPMFDVILLLHGVCSTLFRLFHHYREHSIWHTHQIHLLSCLQPNPYVEWNSFRLLFFPNWHTVTRWYHSIICSTAILYIWLIDIERFVHWSIFYTLDTNTSHRASKYIIVIL